MNCQIKKVIVSISSLGSKLSGEHLTVHLYASNEAEKLLVGRVDFMGKTDADFKCSLNVICPDGFDLSAIAVDEFGAPHPFHVCWDIAVADDLYYPCGGFLTPEKAMSKELSGAAGDVLHALFFRGALVDGDLPSKAGANELRELGYVMTQDTVTPFDGENHYNFLTPTGQEFAISYLVESRFCKKADFQIGAGETFINNTTLHGNIHLTAASDQCLMEPLTDTASACDNIWVLNKSLFGINPFSTAIVKLSDEMREAVIAAVRDSGKFVEKPTGDEQQSVEFRADRFKVTGEVSASGEPTIQQQIQQGANAIIEAAKASLASQYAAMAQLASTQAAITESINQVVNDAIANALRPGGAIHNMLHR